MTNHLGRIWLKLNVVDGTDEASITKTPLLGGECEANSRTLNFVLRSARSTRPKYECPLELTQSVGSCVFACILWSVPLPHDGRYPLGHRRLLPLRRPRPDRLRSCTQIHQSHQQDWV